MKNRMSFSSCDIKSGGIFRLVSRDLKSEVKLLGKFFLSPFSRPGVGNLFDSESQESKILKNLFQ